MSRVQTSDVLSAVGSLSRVFALVQRSQKRLSIVRQARNALVIATPEGQPFRAIASIGWLGDTLYVVDQRPLEVKLLSASGHALRSWRLKSASDSLHDDLFFVDGIFSDHTALVEQRISFDDALDGRIATQAISRLTKGRVPTLITRVDLSHRLMRIVFDSLMGQATLVQPFRDDDLFALSPDGPSVVKVERRVPKANSHPQFVVRSLGPTGQLRFSVTHSYRAIHTSSQAVDSAVRVLVEAIRRHSRFSQINDVARQVRENLFIPSFLPPVTRLLVSADGDIWLERPDLHGDWQVLSPRGNTVDRVRLPPRVRLLAVSGSTLLGSYQTPRSSSDSVLFMTWGKESR